MDENLKDAIKTILYHCIAQISCRSCDLYDRTRGCMIANLYPWQYHRLYTGGNKDEKMDNER